MLLKITVIVELPRSVVEHLIFYIAFTVLISALKNCTGSDAVLLTTETTGMVSLIVESTSGTVNSSNSDGKYHLQHKHLFMH